MIDRKQLNFRCPKTEKWVPVGVIGPASSTRVAATVTAGCPHCGERHRWSAADASWRDPVPAVGSDMVFGRGE